MKNRLYSKRFSGEQEEESLLNLTPLIDVVFVVLIIFIVIAPMLETDRIQLASGGEKKKAAVAEAGSILIRVESDNSIRINERKIASNDLLSALQTAYIQYGKAIPQLFQDKNASFGTYQMIKNAAETAGFEELDVIVLPGNCP